nr:hypothetical protein CFP56_37642 [Quercus suber]
MESPVESPYGVVSYGVVSLTLPLVSTKLTGVSAHEGTPGQVRHQRRSDPSTPKASRYPKQGNGLVQGGHLHP